MRTFDLLTLPALPWMVLCPVALSARGREALATATLTHRAQTTVEATFRVPPEGVLRGPLLRANVTLRASMASGDESARCALGATEAFQT